MKFCKEIAKSYCSWTMNPDFFYFAWVEWYLQKSEEISDKKFESLIYMKPWFRSMVFHTKLKVITRKRLFLGSESHWNHDKIFETLSLARDFVRVGEIPDAKNFKPP